jgi:hypothetical protein
MRQARRTGCRLDFIINIDGKENNFGVSSRFKWPRMGLNFGLS